MKSPIVFTVALLLSALSLSAQFKAVTAARAKSMTLSTEQTPQHITYNGWALNSNFVLPGLRFNLYENKAPDNSKGSIEYFNSIGAGIGVSFGRVTVKSQDIITAENAEDVDIRMKNYVGLSFGVLFSQNNVDSVRRNIFAPVISLQILDVQFGVGWELGSLSSNYKRRFYTITYAIPISKLSNVGSVLLTGKKGTVAGYEKNKYFQGSLF
ncbi:hypothetical protein [Chitinophaga nivalis]|uniref:Outer membrane protein beta-barrel domain-containing protein n=1 Tax=Chitinophaga nivalis TaxID=2991709 RepID=A0ABT3IFF5_9BACT|nr:hypothetical protein [Chitinophaga nivalis]MCW3467616.1 hypothetical protein [Chitinophaga nivalis]MCW3482692.1 hypothetical protein [Chitinophaga nivalis]